MTKAKTAKGKGKGGGKSKNKVTFANACPEGTAIGNVIMHTINDGTRMWCANDITGCERLYHKTALSYASSQPALSKALKACDAEGSGAEHAEARAWILRGAFDVILATLSSVVCEICGSADDVDQLLICDGPACQDPPREYHMRCLDPPLTSVPQGDWLCPHCASAAEHNAAPVVSARATASASVSATESLCDCDL